VKIWMNDRLVEREEARVSVFDHGLLYGDGVFEGIRIYAGRIFRLYDHLARFATGARAIGLELPGGIERVEKAVRETARAFAEREGYIRLICTRGEGELGVDPATCRDPNLVCIASPLRLFAREALERGIDLVTVSVRRPALDALDPRVKSLNYLNNVLARREASLRGAHEGLILNARGCVAEASVANVFAVERGVLSTPPATDGALEGLTRASVLELAAREGVETRERSLSRFDLLGADEVFLTGSGAGLVPVATLDGAAVGSPSRPVLDRIARAFPAYTEEKGVEI